MQTNLFAYTAPGCNYPEFLSVNMDEATRYVEVIARGPVKDDGRCGETVQVKLSPADARALAHGILKTLGILGED